MLTTPKNEALEVHKGFGGQEKCPDQPRFEEAWGTKRDYAEAFRPPLSLLAWAAVSLTQVKRTEMQRGGVNRQYLPPQGMEGGRGDREVSAERK